MCKSGETTSDQPLLTRVLVRGVNIDISNTTINSFLHGSNFTSQVTNPVFYHHLKSKENQHPWLATLIAEGDPLWLNQPSENIYKVSLTQEAKLRWGVVCTHLMPINGENILGDDRAILVGCLMDNVKRNFMEIIAKEIKIRVIRSDTTYLFPCLITRLCTKIGVPHIAGIDETLNATKNHNPIHYKENQPRLTFDRGVRVEVNRLVAGPSSVPEVVVQDSEAAQEGSIADDEVGLSVPTLPAKATSQFDVGVDKIIRAALEPFSTFPSRVTVLLNRFNARAQELTRAELVEFRVDLEKVVANDIACVPCMGETIPSSLCIVKSRTYPVYLPEITSY
ncbi:hypothetical protein CQW23_22263 [Capsicum baccatum]|uniref:Putative plant transposon protein domain-containing protein n=1 Tax=Capsicum baccatum TaxID=33114 RepID=A0A2G2W0D3_CAPBA|nr:hypothetical protein CQW23_22263 [Capsicum baccatum]